jgi:hypothetical protein
MADFLASAHKGHAPTLTEEKVVSRTLLRIKYTAYAILFCCFLFTVTVVISTVVIYIQLQKYQQANKNNLNAMLADARSMMDNAALMTATAVPIVQNFAFMSNAMAAGVASMANATIVNGTAADARAMTTGRHLLDVSQQDIMHADLKTRKVFLDTTRKILHNVEDATSKFNVSNVNTILHAVGTTDWETKLGKRFDRTISDIELASNFMGLSMEAISAVALAKNISLTQVSNSLFASSKKSADTQTQQTVCKN